MDKLSIILRKKDDPDGYNSSELWGRMEIHWNEIIIFSTEWDLKYFIENFVKNEERLLTEPFPYEYHNSLDESRWVIMNKIDDDDIDASFAQLEEFEKYYPYHYFHNDGTKTPSFAIGLNPKEVGEISFSTGECYYQVIENPDGSTTDLRYGKTAPDYYKCEFDMADFVAQFDAEIVHFLSQFSLEEAYQYDFLKDYLGDYVDYIKFVKKTD